MVTALVSLVIVWGHPFDQFRVCQVGYILFVMTSRSRNGLKSRLFLAERPHTVFDRRIDPPDEDATMKSCACWTLGLMILLCGCSSKQAAGKAEMDFQGIKLIAEGRNPGVWNEGGERPFLSVAGKKIVLQKDEIIVDGVTKAKIAPGTKSVRAISHSDEVVVEVDGKEAFKLAR